MTKFVCKAFSILLVLSIVLTGQIFTSSVVFAANADFTSDNYIMTVTYSPKLDLFAGVRKDKTVVMSRDGLNWYVPYQNDGMGQPLCSAEAAAANITWLDSAEQFVVTNTVVNNNDTRYTQPYIYVSADGTDWKTINTKAVGASGKNINIRLLSITYDGAKFWATGMDDAVSEFNTPNGNRNGELSNVFSCNLTIDEFNELEDGDSMVWTKVAADTVRVRAGYKPDLTTQHRGIYPLTNIVTDGKASNSTDSTIIAYSISGYDTDTEAIGRYGIAFRSTDSGATWSQIDMSSHYDEPVAKPGAPEGLWVYSENNIIGYSARGVLNSIYYDPYYDWFIAGFCNYSFILNNDGTAKPVSYISGEERQVYMVGTNEDATYILAQFVHNTLTPTRIYKLPNIGENTYEYFSNRANWKVSSLTKAFNPYEYGLKRDLALKVKADKNDSIIVGANHFLYSADNDDNKKSAVRIDTANGNFITMPASNRSFSESANADEFPEDYFTASDVTAFELSNMEILGNRMKYSLTREPSTIKITGSTSKVQILDKAQTVTLNATAQDQLGNSVTGSPILSLYGTYPDGVTFVDGTLTIPPDLANGTVIKIRATLPDTTISSIYTISVENPTIKIDGAYNGVYAYSVAYSPETDLFVAATKGDAGVIVSRDGKNWIKPSKTAIVDASTYYSAANNAIYLDDAKSFVLLNGFNAIQQESYNDLRGAASKIFISQNGMQWKAVTTKRTTDDLNTQEDIFLTKIVYDGKGKFWAIGADTAERYMQGYIYYCAMTPDQFNAQADGSIMLWTKVTGAPANYTKDKSLPEIATRAQGSLGLEDSQHHIFGDIVTNGKGGIIVYSPMTPHRINADKDYVWDRNGLCFYTNDYGKTWNQLDLSNRDPEDPETPTINKIGSTIYSVIYDKYFDKFISVFHNRGELFEIDTATGISKSIPHDRHTPWRHAVFMNTTATLENNDRLYFVDQRQTKDSEIKVISIPRTVESAENLNTKQQYVKATTDLNVSVVGYKRSWAAKPKADGSGYIFVGATTLTSSYSFAPGFLRFEVDTSAPESAFGEYINTYYTIELPTTVGIDGTSVLKAISNSTVKAKYTANGIYNQLGEVVDTADDVIWSLENAVEGVSINSATGELSVAADTAGGAVKVVALTSAGQMPKGEKTVYIIPAMAATAPVVTVDDSPIEAIVAGKTAIASTTITNSSKYTSSAVVVMALYEKSEGKNVLRQMTVGSALKIEAMTVNNDEEVPFEKDATARMVIPDYVTDNEDSYFLKVFVLENLNNMVPFNNTVPVDFCK